MLDGVEWLESAVEERLMAALDVLALLPDRERAWRRVGAGAIWRRIVHDWEAYGWHDAVVRLTPTRADLAAMDEALGWVEWLAPPERRLLAVVLDVRRRGRGSLRRASVRRRLGLDRTTTTDALRARHRHALGRIAGRLNAARVRRGLAG